MHTVEALPLIGLPPSHLSPSAAFAKRLLDIIVASISLLVLAPLFAFIAWRIKRDSPRPGLLPADAARTEHERVHGPQVQNDAARRRR